MKQIIVNVSGLSVEEKQRVNEALVKITGARKIPLVSSRAGWFFAPSSSNKDMVSWDWPSPHETSTHTPQQVLEMAGMAKQGHGHAELMVQYASIATTAEDPWNYFEIFHRFDGEEAWITLQEGQFFREDSKYRRKPKTHTVNGVEVPDLRFVPNEGEEYHLPNPLVAHLFITATCGSETYKYHRYHRVSNNLCYEPTEEGKQAAILHAKAWLGIA